MVLVYSAAWGNIHRPSLTTGCTAQAAQAATEGPADGDGHWSVRTKVWVSSSQPGTRGFRDPEADQALRKEKLLSVDDQFWPPRVLTTATAGARSQAEAELTGSCPGSLLSLCRA